MCNAFEIYAPSFWQLCTNYSHHFLSFVLHIFLFKINKTATESDYSARINKHHQSRITKLLQQFSNHSNSNKKNSNMHNVSAAKWVRSGVSNWLYSEKTAFCISTGCNCNIVNLCQSWQSWQSVWCAFLEWYNICHCHACQTATPNNVHFVGNIMFSSYNIHNIHEYKLNHDVPQNVIHKQDKLCGARLIMCGLPSYAEDHQICTKLRACMIA